MLEFGKMTGRKEAMSFSHPGNGTCEARGPSSSDSSSLWPASALLISLCIITICISHLSGDTHRTSHCCPQLALSLLGSTHLQRGCDVNSTVRSGALRQSFSVLPGPSDVNSTFMSTRGQFRGGAMHVSKK